MRVRLLNASASPSGVSLPGRAVIDVDDKIKVEVDQYESGGRLMVDEKGNPVKKIYTLGDWMIATRQAVAVPGNTPLGGVKVVRDELLDIEGRTGQEDAIRQTPEMALAANRRQK